MNVDFMNVAFLNLATDPDTTKPPAREAPVASDGLPQAVAVSSTSRLRVRFGSTGMPGPMVVETVTFFR